ncbi:MAG: aminoacetone oxidase family FAD-binding enzyme [Caldilineaceae bacterium]
MIQSTSLPAFADVAIIGAGAAGLMAAIWAGRAHPQRTIVVLDGARKLGAKILVAGGGRCNVTHAVVDAAAYAGSSRNAIKKVLRRFDVTETVAFFQELGVALKREESGKLFPVTDQAQSVLTALLSAVQHEHVALLHPYRVESVNRDKDTFILSGAWGTLAAQHVILATGGRALPKSGSDGHGYHLAHKLGHTLTTRIFPALVPLTLPKDHFLCALSGVSTTATLEVRASNDKQLASFTDSTLCTHFGLSGPAALDISRYWIDAQLDDPDATLVINWWSDATAAELEAALLTLGKQSPLSLLRTRLPERLARALCDVAQIAPGAPAHSLMREQRKRLVRTVTAMVAPVTGNRGYTYAEVTAGGIPLDQLDLKTMASRCCPGLHLCGEICDVDGRIGGYNFQWAWSSGYVAGISV